MPPAARITDLHTCPMATPGSPPTPHVGGPVLGPGVPTVLIGSLPAAVVGDLAGGAWRLDRVGVFYRDDWWLTAVDWRGLDLAVPHPRRGHRFAADVAP